MGLLTDALPIEETRKIVNKLRQCNGNIKFTALEQEEHGIQYLYEKNEIFEWLLKQHK